MSLRPGTTIGVFEVVSSLGAGGMGEVYRARDTKLGRDVALKILPDVFAGDPERLARFEREAKTLAALNHPHIAQIHGFEDSQGTRALVMELVEGEDLTERIARGPIPLDEAIAIGRQIADALEAAHEQGIIHRDLKPANVKLRADGTVKVLDFGLAKAFAPADSESSGVSARSAANSPTITSPAAMTMHGVILGTAAYMSPEQARGKPVDKRADIWAFGCVFFEMLTARRAFGGEEISDTLASVLKEAPPLETLPAAIPAAVRDLLRRCLEKNPKERLRDIGDVRLQLDELRRAAAHTSATPAVGLSRVGRTLPWVIAAVALVASMALGVVVWRRPAATPRVDATRFVIQPPPQAGRASEPVLAPDGSFVVYQADRLYLHRLADFEPRVLPGTENARWPFVSPDGRWIGFYGDGKMKKIAVAGGDPLIITDVGIDTPGAAWALDDRIIFSAGWNDAPLMAVPADGGAVTQVSTLDAGRRERGHWWPRPLPDGRHVLFTIWYAGAGLSESFIGVLDLQTGKHRSLFLGAMPVFADGHLLYYRAGSYQLAAFDVESLTTIGEPRTTLPDAGGLAPQGSSEKPITVSASGTIGYLADEFLDEHTIAWIDRNGREQPTALKVPVMGLGELSPEGDRLALGRAQGGTSQVWIYDLRRGGEQRLHTAGMAWEPVWHPDGQRVAILSMRNGDFDVVVQRLDGSPAAGVLTTGLDEEALAWTPDGQRMIVKDWRPDGATSVFLLDPAKDERTPLVTGTFEKGVARVSPDGQWLAFCGNPSGPWQLIVRPLTGAAGLQPIASSMTRACHAHWSRRSKHLFFVRGSELIELGYDDRDGRFVPHDEKTIAKVPAGTFVFGVSPDSQRLLISKLVPRPSTVPSGIRIILNGVHALMARSSQ